MNLANNNIRALQIEGMSLDTCEQSNDNNLFFIDLTYLARCTSLERLKIIGMTIQGLFENLIVNRSVKELAFSHCEFVGGELRKMKSYVGKDEGVLQSLWFQSSLYGNEVSYLAKGLCRNTSLRVLDLDETYMHDEVVAGLSPILFFNHSITHLKLPIIRLPQTNSTSAVPLGNGLHVSTLRHLTLREDPQDVPSSTAYNVALMEYLATSPTLQKVITDTDGLNIPLLRARNLLNDRFTRRDIRPEDHQEGQQK